MVSCIICMESNAISIGPRTRTLGVRVRCRLSIKARMRCRFAPPLTTAALGGGGRNSAGALRLTAIVRSTVSSRVAAVGGGFTKAPSRRVLSPEWEGGEIRGGGNGGRGGVDKV